MSRAFVNEDAPDATLDEAPELKIPIPAGSRNYLTPEGAAALVAELSRLETETRPGLLAEIDKACRNEVQADRLSGLRAELARANRRIQYLATMSSLAETIQPPAQGYQRVSFGASILVRDNEGKELRYRIVGVDEARPEDGLLGWTSPIARGLTGKMVGDRVTIRLPESELVLVVMEIY